MTNEVESRDEALALQEKIGKLTECGWSDDPDDQYALRLMWYAGRDWAALQVQEREKQLREALLDLSGGGAHPCWCGRLPHTVECLAATAAIDGQPSAVAATPNHDPGMEERMSKKCPAIHETHECELFGSAYWHAIIRALWAWQVREWEAGR